MEEKEIDLMQIVKSIWAIRIKLIKYAVIGAVIGIVIGFSIPKEYTTSIVLAPEGKSGGSSMSSLGSVFGISTMSGADGVQSSLYPEVITSLPFMVELFSVEVSYKGEKMTFYDYMAQKQQSPWWSYIIGFPMKSLAWVMGLFKEKVPEADISQIGIFRLSAEQANLVNGLRDRINPAFDNKKQLLMVDVKMQDAEISAVMADTLVSKFKRYMYDYWTSKDRENLASSQVMYEQAKKNYYQADSLYAVMVDKNRALSSESAKIKLERLANEKVLTFSVYQQTSAKLEADKIKLQERVPVLTVIEPPTVPVRATSPKKSLIMVFFAFLGVMVGATPVLYKTVLGTLDKPEE